MQVPRFFITPEILKFGTISISCVYSAPFVLKNCGVDSERFVVSPQAHPSCFYCTSPSRLIAPGIEITL